MAQDPNSGYGSNPQNPYGQPQPPQNPYGQPAQNPYGQQQQAPYPDTQNPYGQVQSPYGAPQTGYGAPGYAALAPLPLGLAIQQLPQQYIKVTTKPSATSFAEELPKAAWDITWIQLLFWVVAGVVLGLVGSLFTAAATAPFMGSSGNAASMMAATTAFRAGGSGFGAIIGIPLAFFIVTGVQYLLAKMFGGQGTFLGQAYSMLLFQVPLGILSTLIGIIPFVGLLAFVVNIYAIVLNVFQIMASHRLSGGKATAVVLIPIGALLLFGILCAVVAGAVIFSILRGASGQ